MSSGTHLDLLPRDSTDVEHVEFVAANTVVASVVGSHLAGLATDSSDVDEMAVAVEPPSSVFGVTLPRFEVLVSRPRGEREASRPGDVERTTYSLRKFLNLAAAGNPHVLSLLWAPDEFLLVRTRLGDALRELRSEFVTSHAVSRFYGYASDQLRRLTGELGQRNVKRPDLEAQFGFDTKYAAHVLQLTYQGRVFATQGFIHQPLPEPVRSDVLAVRLGAYSLEETVGRLRSAVAELKLLLPWADEKLPSCVDSDKLTAFSRDAHYDWWRSQGLI